MPPMMVAPLRLVPGTKARHCASPTMRASRARISSIACTRTAAAGRRSAHKITTPPSTKLLATTAGRKSAS